MNSAVEGVKVCRSCKLMLPLEQFHKHTETRDKLQPLCKVCNTSFQRAYRRSENGYFRSLVTNTRSNVRDRARRRNQPFDPDFFTRDFVSAVFRNQHEMSCPLCSQPFAQRKKVVGKQGQDQTSLSFDCVIPELGYTRGNVMAICFRCNARKSDGSLDWFKRVIAAVESRIGLINMPRIDPPMCTP